MNIEAAKSDFEVALKVASMTVGTGSDLSSHYLFRVQGGQAEVLSYNLRVFSRAPIKATTDGDGAFTVEAWRLDKWIASVGDGVLTLSADENGGVLAKGPRSRIKLRSLDASRFPYWDGLLDHAEEQGESDPASLYRAFDLTKLFVSTEDTTRPNICQTEITDSVLMATNRGAVALIEIKDLPNLNLRISGKDLPVVAKFLSDKVTAQSDVTVKTASRPDQTGSAAALFCRDDGSYVGVSRPALALPKIPIEKETPQATLTLDVEEFQKAVGVLLCSAPKGHGMASFSVKDDALVVSMPSEAGGEDTYPMVVSQAQGMGDLSFTMDYHYIKAIADLFDLDTLSLGVHQRGKGGYVSFAHEDEGATDESGNHYYTLILWRS